MRILIGVCILIVLLIPYYCYKFWIVSLGFRYCQQVDSILKSYNDMKIPESKDTKYVKQKIRDVEYIIELNEEFYSSLSKNERHFRLDDWVKVFSSHEKIEELKTAIKYQKWLHEIK